MPVQFPPSFELASRARSHSLGVSSDKGNTRLRIYVRWRLRLRRKLEHQSLLTLCKIGQENNLSIRKFERIVVRTRLVFVDLPKNRGLSCYCLYLPTENSRG